jgi:hypothetical protein
MTSSTDRHDTSAKRAVCGLAVVVGLLLSSACSSASKGTGAQHVTSPAPTSSTPGTTAASTAKQTSGVPNPCTLVTAAEVTTAFGVSLVAGPEKAAIGGHGQTCDFGTGATRLLIQVYPSPAFYVPKQQMASPQPVSGPWDKGSQDSVTSSIDYVKNNMTVFLSVISLGARPTTAKMLALATASAGRL